MIDFKTVLLDFMSISGLEEPEAKNQTKIINLAINYVSYNLKPGIDIKQNQNLLSMLAASIAYHKYILIKESLNSNSSVKLGDISINSNSLSTIKIAENLKNEFISLASHLLISSNFIFFKV